MAYMTRFQGLLRAGSGKFFIYSIYGHLKRGTFRGKVSKVAHGKLHMDPIEYPQLLKKGATILIRRAVENAFTYILYTRLNRSTPNRIVFYGFASRDGV